MSLTQFEIRSLFSYNKKTGILRWKVKSANTVQKGDIAGNMNSEGYLQVGVNNKTHHVHRVIWLGLYGYWPEHDIDHKDRIRHHNWKSNLRESSRMCNSRNSNLRSNNKSGVKGVFFSNGENKWTAQIGINGKRYYLGYYKDFDNAVCARLAAEQCLDWNKCDLNSTPFNYVKKYIQNRS